MKPRCHNRPPFNDTVQVQDGWYGQILPFVGKTRIPHMVEIPDPMSKDCKQHGPMGEATLHPEQWACDGCEWKPEE